MERAFGASLNGAREVDAIRTAYVRAVAFSVSAEAYDRFMGRYSVPLAPLFVDFAGVTHDGRVLDVGCGPGALTSELVLRLGPASVAAVDPRGLELWPAPPIGPLPSPACRRPPSRAPRPRGRGHALHVHLPDDQRHRGLHRKRQLRSKSGRSMSSCSRLAAAR